MDALGLVLNWLAEWGFIFVVAGLIAFFCIRKPAQRRGFMRALLLLGGIVIGSIFLAAAYGKLKPLAGFPWTWGSIKISIALFAIQVESYQLVSAGTANTIAHVLPFVELAIGLWLVTGIFRRYASIVACLAFCGFMIAIFSAYQRGLKIDCGCGVGPPQEAGPAALLRDGLRFLLPALIVCFGAFWIRRRPTVPLVAETSSATASH